jgi:hypothetical protein
MANPLTLNRLAIGQFSIGGLDIPMLSLDGETIAPPKQLTKEQKLRKYLTDLGITGISGTEGMGKSLMMTRIGTEFYGMGGTVLAFPGYELKDDKGKVISKSITVEEWVTMPDTLKNVLILIDEIEDHFNAQAWQSILVRLFTGVFGERRKRNMGIVYTLQFFNELPKLMRWKTHYIIECKDAAIYNPFRVQKGEREYIPGESTYTTIIDNFGKKWPFVPGYRHKGPTYRNVSMFDRYEHESITDIFNQFTKIEIKRKVVSIDLNNDGVTTQAESIESQRLYDNAKTNLIHAMEAKNGRLKGNEYWKAAHLDAQSKAHQKIASELNEELGIEKTTGGVYHRDFALVNA